MKHLKIKKISGGFLGLFPKYMLLEDYCYEFQYDHRRAYFIILAGFEYDGATMGSFLFWRKSMHESAHTIAHDWLYIKLGLVNARFFNHVPVGPISKSKADEIFLEGARRDVNVQSWRDRIASGAFKTFGAILWYKRKWFR